MPHKLFDIVHVQAYTCKTMLRVLPVVTGTSNEIEN